MKITFTVLAALAMLSIANAQEVECRTRWKPSINKLNAYCVRYGGNLWLCPVESCRRKR